MTRVLVVEDEPQLARALRINLSARGYDVDVAPTGAAALRLAAQNPPDVVLLDLGLPDLDGQEVIAGLRGWTDVPIIVLSGRTGSNDKVQALDAGADDYVTKPFGMEELLARIRAATRRTASDGSTGTPVAMFGDVTVDFAARQVRRARDGGPAEPVHLTPTEWHLIEVLGRDPGKLLDQRYLIRQVWGPTAVNQVANLRLYMTQLRRKLEPDPSRPRYLVTEPGMGYRFQPDA